jgi:GNAT superfamily N-acetyltransferase
VVAYEDDVPVASCIVWYDPGSRAAEIEPLGVVPEARGRGLARLVIQEAVRRVASRRGREVVVRPRGDDDYPVPLAVYLACGFVVNQRDRVYSLG